MSNDPGDKPPAQGPYAPPAKEEAARAQPEPAPSPVGEPSAPANPEPLREARVAMHHAPLTYQPAQFPPPDGGPVAPYNPHGPPGLAPPPPGAEGGPMPGAGVTPPDAQHPYGAVPPQAYWQQPGYAPPPQLPFPSVGWFVLLVLMGFFGQIVVGAGAVVVLLAVDRPNLGSGNAQNVLNQLPVTGFMAILFLASLTWPAVALVAARVKGVLNRDTFRIRWPGMGVCSLAVVLGLALVPLALLLENLVARVVPRGDNVIIQIMAKGPGVLALTLLGLTLVVAAPVGEELLFRGLGYRGIEKRHGLGLGALVVSLIFAGVHLNATGFLALFMVSMCLCWVTSKTGSLIPAILLHAAYNGVQFLMLLGSKVTPDMAKKASKSTELGIPLWAIPVGLILSLGCLYAIEKLGAAQSETPAVD